MARRSPLPQEEESARGENSPSAAATPYWKTSLAPPPPPLAFFARHQIKMVLGQFLGNHESIQFELFQDIN